MDDDLFQPLKLCFTIFKTVGLWQDGQQSWPYFIYGYFVHFFFIDVYVVCQIVYTINASNLLDFVDALGFCTTYIALVFKSVNFLYNFHAIMNILEMLKDLLTTSHQSGQNSDRHHIRKQIGLVFKIYKMFWFCSYLSCAFAILLPVFQHIQPYKLWFPFNTETSETGFWIASGYEVLNTLVISVTDISLDILPVIFMGFAVGLINELSDRLRNVKTNAELIECIRIHKQIKKFILEIQAYFSIVIVVQGLMSSVILCTSAFTMSTASDLGALLLLTFMVPMVLEIFLPCYFGNEISLASAGLSEALFHSQWFNSDAKTRRTLKIFMENTKKELKISAFGVFTANLETFMRIGNTAYSLFAVLTKANN